MRSKEAERPTKARVTRTNEAGSQTKAEETGAIIRRMPNYDDLLGRIETAVGAVRAGRSIEMAARQYGVPEALVDYHSSRAGAPCTKHSIR